MRKGFLIRAILTISALFGVFFTHSLVAESNSFSLSAFILKQVRLSSAENGNSKLELLSKDRKEGSEFFLDFEEKDASDLTDKSGGYRIVSSSYLPDTSKVHSGKRAARFAGKRSGIKISGKTKGILTASDIREEFYLSFFLLPGTLDKEAVLISKELYTRGRKFGWDLHIKDEIPVLEFRNFFQREDKTFASLKLSGKNRVSRSEWNHFIIHFRPAQREVVFYVNGKETDRASVSRKEPIVRIGFHPEDTTPFKIGENFYGWLDDFFASKGAPDPETISNPYEGQTYDPSSFTAEAKFGTALSPVYKTRYSNSFPESITVKAKIPKSSVLEIYLRTSPKNFSRTEEGPAWRSVDLRKISEEYKEEDPARETEEESIPSAKSTTYRIPLDKIWNGKLPPFKYYQAKIKFKPDPQAQNGPEVDAFAFSYKETIPPVKPMGLKVAYFDDSDPDAGNSPRVCLSWTPNPEKNVKNKGGYVIHYGVGPNRMVGILKGTSKDLEKGKVPVLDANGKEKHPMSEYLDPILGEDSSCPKQSDMGGPKLCQCIDNRLISLNAEKPEVDSEEVPSKGKKKKRKPYKDPYDKRLLFLQKGLTFYFKIAAFNSYYDPETGSDQLSPLSDPAEVYFLSE
ncbi:hypothetical protein [Leptospira wolffii]|uniref:hypothetical protein n=1 Tax=Leptospira wolffii TaxID=409998 RepID=UPI000353ED66|nr:hypothetical protein [Leptospira wolffii]EPG65353.1 hypothetical protein LEP1GSC061_2568 [Leptospira wolffii serovar Khorat str. Khorat-H2]